jgi:hypothetical protein
MRTNAATVQLIKQLPKSIKAKLSLNDLTVIEGLANVVDRISAYFINTPALERELRHYKRSKGICGGRPQCLTHTGPKVDVCSVCAHARDNPTRKNTRSEYGRIMRKRKLVAKE